MRQIQLAGLRVRLSGGTDGNGNGEGPIVVLLHGYGAPGDDLVPLARELHLPGAVRFAFPEGVLPLDLDGLPALAAEPRAWWPIDLMELQDALASGNTRVLGATYPAGLAAARQAIVALLDALETELGVRSANLILGGFSQGAILSCDVALHDPRPLAGLALMSGSLVGGAVWEPLFANRQGTAVFQSHGRGDPLLPFGVAKELHSRFVTAGWQAEFVEFSGGHGIAVEALSGLRAFLLRSLSPITP